MFLVSLSKKVRVVAKSGALMEGKNILATEVMTSNISINHDFKVMDIFDAFDSKIPKSFDEYTLEEKKDFGRAHINNNYIINIQELDY